ncbi:hypothetical protein CWS19_26125 [Escherichia coli]|uniref:hypothetical protein n=1 Tax=Providencia rettgeri TaxID=587 RepID=UPI000C3316DB|nr:hypothetical protein [Providencia rettgeri]PKD46841.1 hypothetical protein CWS19_26125 [Escherichia coli]
MLAGVMQSRRTSYVITDRETELAERLIKLHDGRSYRELQEMSALPKDPNDDGKITEDMYLDMCRDIENEMGALESIESIDCLPRNESKLTLWKAKYSKSDIKVFWAIGFDSETLKVQDVLVQW